MIVLKPPVEAAPRGHGVKHRVLRRQPNRLGCRGLRFGRRLAGYPQLEPAVGQPRGGGGGLERRVSGRGNLIPVGHSWRAAAAIPVAASGDAARLAPGQPDVERLRRALAAPTLSGPPHRRHRGERPFSGPPGLANRGDPAPRLHYLLQAAYSGARGFVEADQLGLADRAVADCRIEHARQTDVASEREASVDFGRQVETRPEQVRLRLADIGRGLGVRCRLER